MLFLTFCGGALFGGVAVLAYVAWQFEVEGDH